MSSTRWLGRHSRTPFTVHTIGRLTNTGYSTMRSRISSCDTPSSSRPSSFAGDLDARRAVRGFKPAAAKRPSSCGFVHPSLRYSITWSVWGLLGCDFSAASIMASALRELPHSGLW
eukprot:CAMPEP_0173317956 /NCGR_PEP_ID=MMETSP1143-20121109/27391_1 /TAXON_ID=483371 /ORGANISM="non described non described, Strain CCMP2298" /LENGTH=115 /DNA_ID=CAMNT_0014261151 /DNA_START=1208 /DNA_END=1555 /DNA_ORIENTATION=-